MMISEQFRSIALSDNATERRIHAFLKQYPYVLIHLFNRAWNFYRIFSEFRLGTEFRADFVIISADSGSWHGHFVELKGPRECPYTQSATPTKKLNLAIRQTNDWHDFTCSQRASLMREFSRLMRPLRKPAQNHLIGSSVTADVELQHPRTHIDFAYHVVIGNSEDFTEEQRTAHARYSQSHGVATYDRLWRAMCELEDRCDTLDRQMEFLSRAGR